jgi:N-acylneuraminate cytidylyltransferase
MLKAAGLPVVVLSTERNPVVVARCEKLGIECVQGLDDKLETLKSIAQQHGVSASQVAFVGNDINDLSCLRWVGVPIAVADSVAEVLAAASVITRCAGGDGAVREIADAWLAAHRHALANTSGKKAA